MTEAGKARLIGGLGVLVALVALAFSISPSRSS